MIREYRGWSVNFAKWEYGYLWIDNNDYFIRYRNDTGNIVDRLVDPKSIGQWTGLLDKNGTKIFEGDIVTSNHRNLKKAAVVFSNGVYQVKQKDAPRLRDTELYMIQRFHSLEVIGNTYQNPELLEDKS